jgi:hypothetical protein
MVRKAEDFVVGVLEEKRKERQTRLASAVMGISTLMPHLLEFPVWEGEARRVLVSPRGGTDRRRYS